MDVERTLYKDLVDAARAGNRDASIKILEEINWLIQNRRKVPKIYRIYLNDCLSDLQDPSLDLNKKFNLKTNKKGRKPATGRALKKHIDMFDYVNRKMVANNGSQIHASWPVKNFLSMRKP